MAAAITTLNASAVIGAGVDRGDRLDPYWDTTEPRGRTRTISFRTDAGTGMSVDISPDQRWIVVDLLGNIYRLPATGGKAEILTGDSGIALNFHPVFSPDGTRIAFISDRSGQNNLWIMNADGSDPRPLFLDPTTRISEPVWSPDGKSIVAVRSFATPGRGWHRVNTQIWRFPLDRGKPELLIAGKQEQYNSPSVSPDGQFVYFHVSYFARNRFGTQAGHRLQRIPAIEYRLRRVELDTGDVTEMSKHDGPLPTWRDYIAPDQSSMPVDSAAEIMPLVSPDGRYLAFAREMVGETFEYRGHRHGPSTALIVRDLQSGVERVVLNPITKDLSAAHAMYSYRVLPRFAWTADSGSIVLSVGGKLERVDVVTGDRRSIQFEAAVHRVISEMARGNVRISDDTFPVTFIQWPTSSPDGSRIAFVAAGSVWIQDLSSGTSRPLLPPAKGSIQLTPAWSPDGKRIAFVTWNERERGQVISVNSDGTDARRLTSAPGEYLYPSWCPDASELVVTSGPGPDAKSGRDGWQAAGDWTLLRLSVSGGIAQPITKTKAMHRAVYGPAGVLFFSEHDDPAALIDLTDPWPHEHALNQATQLVSIQPAGTGRMLRATLSPATASESLDPIPSPDGRWVAFRVDDDVFVAPLVAGDPHAQKIATDPSDPSYFAVRASALGGSDISWRDDHTLQFASGNKYVTYDAVARSTEEYTVQLALPRERGTGTLALTNARVITMEGDRILARATILVEDARIRCVGKCDISKADRVIDLKGKSVIPGLVDVHEHQTGSDGRPAGVIVPHRRAQLMTLAYGITTIVDPSVDSESAFPLAEMIEAGTVSGPRTFSSAEMVIPSATAFGQRTLIRSLRDAQHIVSRRANWGAVTIKNYRNESRDQQQKLIAAARERGISITGEGGPMVFDLGVIMDGQTGWEHHVADLPIYKDVAQFAGQAGVTYSPTVSVAGHGEGAALYFRPRHDFQNDVRNRRFSPQPQLSLPAATPPPLERFSFPIVAEGLADLVRAGGYGAIGAHGEEAGIGSHWEIWSYATALSPLEALRVATIDGARFIGLDKELGSITPGKIADLVILEGDPLRNIRNTASLTMVVKAGKLYESATLDEIRPQPEPLGPAQRTHTK
jgi:Tol biopolymer transport system component/imidazolonepropionase-like amidohydrolase